MKLNKLIISTFLLSCFLMSCKTNLPPRDTLDTLGPVVPYAIDKMQDRISLGFIPHARVFYLDVQSPQSATNIKMLEESMSSRIPVNVFLFPGTTDIALIKKTTKKERELHKKKWSGEKEDNK